MEDKVKKIFQYIGILGIISVFIIAAAIIYSVFDFDISPKIVQLKQFLLGSYSLQLFFLTLVMLVLSYFLIRLIAAGYGIKLPKWFSRPNPYVLTSIILIVIVIYISVTITVNLIPKPLSITDSFENDYINGLVTCYSLEYSKAVPGDTLECYFKIESKNQTNNLTLIKITTYLDEQKIDINENPPLLLITNKQKFSENKRIKIPENKYFKIQIQVETEKGPEETKEIPFRTYSEDAVISEKNTNTNNLFAILFLGLTLGIFSIFAGINNLRQIIERTAENSKRKRK